MSTSPSSFSTPSEPVDVNYLEDDLHALNKEIVRLAFFLGIRLEDHQTVHRIIQGEWSAPSHHSVHLDVLRGLLVLRGKMRQERVQNGEPDGTSPVAEAIFYQLRVPLDDDESNKSV